jgi:hypothetical protein
MSTTTNAQLLTRMTNKRGYAASAKITSTSFIVTGGRDEGNNVLSSSEIIDSYGSVTPGPELPLPLYQHSMININDTLMLIIGGFSSGNIAQKKTYFVDKQNQEWSDGPELITARRLLAAGIVNDEVTQEKLIIATGGYDGSSYLKSTEILIDGQWSLGPELPFGISSPSMVPFGSGQAIIGGFDGSYQGKIYHLTCAQRICNIEQMTQELSVPRSTFVAIPIPDHLSGCTED